MITPKEKPKIDIDQDAWSRFERAVDVVAKSPPQHRVKRKTKKRVAESIGKDSTKVRKKGGRHP